MVKNTPKRHRIKDMAVPLYKQSKVPVGWRVTDLLAHMTLEEKAAQMMCIWQEKAQILVDPKGNFDPSKARAAFAKRLGLGQVGRPSDAGAPPAAPWLGRSARQMAELTNAIQKFFIEDSRLGIPVFFHEECLHGHAARDATSFPQPIGLGATFNPMLVEQLFAMTAYEARARGASGAHAGGGCGARSALGPRGGDLWRRPPLEHPAGNRGGSRLPSCCGRDRGMRSRTRLSAYSRIAPTRAGGNFARGFCLPRCHGQSSWSSPTQHPKAGARAR